MSNFEVTRGAVLASAVAAVFTAGCVSQDQEKASPAQQGETAVQPGKPGAREEAVQGQAEGQASEVKVACFGINACKGQSDCATPNNACKGMNACKGQGFKYVSLRECEVQGGKVITPSM